jgi:outer membrane protein, multidrug efflux system
MVENYSKSLDIKKQQLDALEASVTSATRLFQNARVSYMDVLFSQRDLRDARNNYIDLKKMQLSAIVNTYQALGGGLVPIDYPGSKYVPPKTRWPWQKVADEEIPARPLPESIPSPLPESPLPEVVSDAFTLPEAIPAPLPAVENTTSKSP